MDFVDVVIRIGLLAGLLSVVKAFLPKDKKSDASEVTARKAKISKLSVDLIELANRIEPVMEKLAHASAMLDNREFEKAVVALANDQIPINQASNYALGANWILSCIGFEALTRRDDSGDLVDKVVKAVPSVYTGQLFFLLRFVEAKATSPVAARILCGAQYWWPTDPAVVDQMTTYLEKALADGETIAFGQQYAELDSGGKENLDNFIKALPDSLQKELRARLEEHDEQAIDWAFLKTVGTILDRDAIDDPFFETSQTERISKELADELESMPGKSVLLVGEPGVGKSTLMRRFAKDLMDKGWTVLQTSAAALIADKAYVGQIEGQIQKLAKNASVSKKIAVYIENMSEIRQLGRYTGNDNSVLDQLWPNIQSRTLFLIGETTPAGLRALKGDQPSLPTVTKVTTIEPAHEGETAAIATRLLELIDPDMDKKQVAEVVSESLQLAQQYLAHKSLPGSVLSLLKLAYLRAQREDDSGGVNREHVLGALSQVSGLPREVLDDKQKLDIEAVAQSFKSHIIGQDEAVDCLVERIAMLKAGLTDPGRPIGVFLFAGPTGTGKTEIAKTLADMLFGSSEQMIRLDMSEFQDPESTRRLVGWSEKENSDGSLVNRIRENPFSVVLLDEFEKAHAKVWDFFLQVFDDGRLTDANGQLADFRHAIIILTSNLGATIGNEAGVGFTSTSGGFSDKDVMRSVNRTFRREFINRLDRVVVFRPLNREVMRTILHIELDKALDRRGLRTKQWAVEWEDSAIEFLLAEGFTPDLGARPLRRAIERHLLAPLSITMVQNQVPAGEQFLFVRSNGEALQVEFIDPDADDEVAASSDVMSAAPREEIDLAGLIIATSLPSNAAQYLAGEMAAVAQRVDSDSWADDKSRFIDELNKDGFWDREDRYDILDRIELIDRLDSAASVLGRLSERLQQHPENTKLVRSIAKRLYVLREGFADLDLKRPTQAYIGVRLVTTDTGLAGANEFLQRLTDMYRYWARERGMRLREIDATSSRYDALFAISGFGSYGILQPESGLHVFEIPKGRNRFDRIRARVEVAGVPVSATEEQTNRATKATTVLDKSAGKVEIVRRYRQDPSPLARDSVRGWRTGKLNTVFGGNFDVLAALD